MTLLTNDILNDIKSLIDDGWCVLIDGYWYSCDNFDNDYYKWWYSDTLNGLAWQRINMGDNEFSALCETISQEEIDILYENIRTIEEERENN